MAEAINITAVELSNILDHAREGKHEVVEGLLDQALETQATWENSDDIEFRLAKAEHLARELGEVLGPLRKRMHPGLDATTVKVFEHVLGDVHMSDLVALADVLSKHQERGWVTVFARKSCSLLDAALLTETQLGRSVKEVAF